MRPDLHLTPSKTPTFAPRRAPHTAPMGLRPTGAAVRHSRQVGRASREPTVPSPPPAAGRASMPWRGDGEGFSLNTPYRLPLDLLDHVNPGVVRELASSIRARTLRGRVDLPSIYDTIQHSRAEALRAARLRLHLATSQPTIVGDSALIEEVAGHMVDVAIAVSPPGSRLAFVAREVEGLELVLSSAASSHTGPDQRPLQLGESLDALPLLQARFEECRAMVQARGGQLTIDSDRFCTTIHFSMPRATAGTLPLPGALVTPRSP
jgi:hypothetical protein